MAITRKRSKEALFSDPADFMAAFSLFWGAAGPSEPAPKKKKKKKNKKN